MKSYAVSLLFLSLVRCRRAGHIRPRQALAAATSRWLDSPVTVDGSPVDWPGPLAPFNDRARLDWRRQRRRVAVRRLHGERAGGTIADRAAAADRLVRPRRQGQEALRPEVPDRPGIQRGGFQGHRGGGGGHVSGAAIAGARTRATARRRATGGARAGRRTGPAESPGGARRFEGRCPQLTRRTRRRGSR